MVKVLPSNSTWLFSAVYASSRSAERQILWNNLMQVANLHNMPWMLAGDFNEPLLKDDKFGGQVVNVDRALLFKDCLDKCNMIDIGFSGPRFTWTNKRDVQALIQERIDRFFVNLSWCLMYPEARVTYLTRCHSDHCPVLMEMLPRMSNISKRPFKFQTCWLLNPTFPNVVSEAWNQSVGLVEATEKFSKDVAHWNKTHFGNVFNWKKYILARLNGIQRTISVRPSSFLLNLERELQGELEMVLKQEEEIWALKSWVSWMIQGDRNTAFYHVSTLVRQKLNKILAIKDNVGEWLFEENDIKGFIRAGFGDLYTTSLVSGMRDSPLSTQWQPKLTEEEKVSISGVVTVEEIKHALWSLKPFKASGPDGLHAGFYQRFWLIVGNFVIEEVKKVFKIRKVSEVINRTHMALIPKIQGPETLGNYRPISLCNTVYKIVMKIIVARLRPLLGNLISPLQMAFVPGRKGIDNAIIAQEIIHTLGRKKRKNKLHGLEDRLGEGL